MSGIVIKEEKQKVDPRNPKSNPDYKRAWDKGQKILREGKLKFENKGKEEEYWKGIKANENNIPGLPITYPAMTLKSSLNDAKPALRCECGGCCVRIDSYICPRCGKQNIPN